jgi:hypothetical protein
MFNFQWNNSEREFKEKLDMQRAHKQVKKTELEADGHIEKFSQLAREAREYGNVQGYNAAFKFIEKSLQMKQLCISQKIALQGASLSLVQAKSATSFAEGMSAASRSLTRAANLFKPGKISGKIELANLKADQMQEEISLMMDNVLGDLDSSSVPVATKAEIESLINGPDKANSQAQVEELNGMLSSIADMRKSIQERSS